MRRISSNACQNSVGGPFSQEVDGDRRVPLPIPRSALVGTRTFHPSHALQRYLIAAVIFLGFCAFPASAVLIPFENCLPDDYKAENIADGETVPLQWVPLYVDAKFDVANPSHRLNFTVWGNVTGQTGNAELPPWDSDEWNDPGRALAGKIQNEPPATNGQAFLTTLFTKVDVANYQPYTDRVQLCSNVQNRTCPIAPVFDSVPEDEYYRLPSIWFQNDFESNYIFTSFAPTMFIWNGDFDSTTIGCVSATVTPSLQGVAWALKFLPLMVLLVVGAATAFAAIFSPWGTSNVFHWTSNYGRDPDLLRLVTPGFGDCLQYIQFVLLTGGLNLDYPGFYQPVASQVSWSSLMFNQSFASGHYHDGLVDGIYVTNGTWGIENLAKLDGMGEASDVWVGMIVWLLVIIAIVLFAIQVGFLVRWVWRIVTNTPEEDYRAKNMPFSMGNVIRLVFSYFLLPLVSLSTFQFVVAAGAPESPGWLTALAVVTLALIIGFAGWLMTLIVRTKPRAYLFDDLPTVLLYGPLYNAFSDEAAPFAIVPIILTFLRGVAIGAAQPSGVAQIVLLAICEVVQSLTLHAFRPFHSPTSMNIYHTGFSIARFITIILMVTFTRDMGITEGPKAWVGCVIFLIHGCILVFGFLLNALQTIAEVIARLAGAGGDDVRGQTRGGLSKIFGARQLQRRTDRGGPSRQSQASTVAMLDAENMSKRGYGRIRSSSAGSMGILMNAQQRSSSALDARSVDFSANAAGAASAMTPHTGDGSSFSHLPSPGQATRPGADPYYRPPRARRGTLEDGSAPSHRPRSSVGSIDLAARRMSGAGPLRDAEMDAPASGRVTPAPQSYAPVFAPRADYSTREVDFYYGVRGPALNSDSPGRKLGTGPADPTSPITTATGWIKGLFAGKTKEKGKGFEVVRSARMPPGMKASGGDFSDDNPPEGIPVAMGVIRNGPIDSDDEDETGKPKVSYKDDPDEAGDSSRNRVASNEPESPTPRPSKDVPPLLPDLDPGEAFRMPSRNVSKATSRYPSQRTISTTASQLPEVPRKSSKRNSSVERINALTSNLPPPTEEASRSKSSLGETHQDQSHIDAARLPFDRTHSQRRKSASGSSLTGTDDLNTHAPAAVFCEGNEERPTSYGYVHQHNISRVDPEQSMDLLGSSAELVDDPRKPSPQNSVSKHSE